MGETLFLFFCFLNATLNIFQDGGRKALLSFMSGQKEVINEATMIEIFFFFQNGLLVVMMAVGQEISVTYIFPPVANLLFLLIM